MTRWRVLALIAIATLVPALTVAVVLADLPPGSRRALLDSLGSQWLVLALGLVVLVAGIGWVAWSTWRSEQRQDARQAADIEIIATVNPAHRLAGVTAVERAVNVLAERHATAEDRLTEQLDSAHAELTRERDVLFAVLTGLDVPVGVVDDSGRILLVNPAARRMLGVALADRGGPQHLRGVRRRGPDPAADPGPEAASGRRPWSPAPRSAWPASPGPTSPAWS